MEASELLTGLLSTAYKMTTEEITELFANTDGAAALKTVLEKDKSRIGEIGTKKFQDGIKKAKAEILTENEAKIREKYGIEDDQLQGEELIESLIAQELTKAGKTQKGAGTILTDDDVKKHKVYQDLEANAKKQLIEKEKEWAGKLTEKETEFSRAQTLGTIKEKALNILTAQGFVLPANAKIAESLKSTFIKDLAGLEYDIQDNRIVVMKDGKVVEDAHGNSRSFEDVVAETATNYFEPKANNGGSNAGNNPTPPGAGGTVKAPDTIDELSKIMNDQSIKLEDRNATLAAWETAHPS